MTSYPFIETFFKSVLEQSKGIQGRFHLCPRFGLEINSDQLESVINDDIKPVSGRKYPMALMMPPRSQGSFTGVFGEWETYRAVMFFLNTTYYTGNNQVKAPNPNTRTSTHSITEDWHDMKRCAVNFLRVLDRIQRQKGLTTYVFRLSTTQQSMIDPVSSIGSDRVSGVRLDFQFSLMVGCDIEDYTTEGISSITVPVADPHPEHKL
ncbi:hypothetical protein [Chitinophaga sancti]|uniref:Uncharacterized protein n=1 Tax=Chitinophaga sancti TaxID=1004 RepID=A0A1K1M2G3_9BACT|nr:hypothetical protein [Chitinophaga sancti]WQD64740.1 hypothetical protein U0033_10065 [Chitinophaga sancti]WQG89638.1 hypothetical protein SR876_32410 [Chitinophaga sancti]SFW16126.1 hypothetical protein SAMN05661012_00331 [Chitinophaga sancti]